MEKIMGTLIKLAVENFKQGNYQQAKEYYQKASDAYGEELFKENITICERYLSLDTPSALSTDQESVTLSEKTQLIQTQALLEYYYTQSQELQHKLMDVK
ncbi:hypothetical protein DN062_02575 [Nitrincola tibetensis]|uniref:Tetratricopeptide repeat protein n=1 Tax=Nitrincola tibetensis TaxID=2219697 RepID=A0A364NQ67_9GAMM|nr:hypothetical protein [Nitrincola tibetensis]RAU19172.1 hypothetical protein DN062_02575 [Nitrincola tibetensis]